MRVLVTGGRGKVGSYAVNALVAAGHRVFVTDLGAPRYGMRRIGEPSYSRADLTDYGQAIATIMEARVDAVVHTAGLPDPIHDPSPHVFKTNTLLNYNVAEAVCRAGVSRLIYLSSETAGGFVTAERPFRPDYLPVDEDHPARPQDAYALSKALGENICDALVARCDATAVSIRLSLVFAPQDYKDLVPMLQRSAASASFNYWSYVDVEDVADLIVKTVEAKTPGHEVIYAAQPDNIAGRPFMELLNELLPSGASAVRTLAREDAGGVNIDKARRLFGWDPKRSWRDHV